MSGEPVRLTLAEIGLRKFEAVETGTCYRLHVPGAMAMLELDRLTWHRNELHGELLVRTELLGTDAVDGVLSVATFNVSSAQARTQRANQLRSQSRAGDIPWQALIEELCQRTLAAERSGEPAIAVRAIERPTDANRLIHVFGFKLPRRHPSILFGDGGAGKTYLAEYLGGLLAREGYRVLLADWELDGPDHRERYEALFGDAIPATLFYTSCRRPLVQEADRLKHIVRNQGIDYAIYDSIGFALTDDPKEAGAALGYFRAERTIGVGALHIAHVNKQDDGDKKPFGSAFFHNSARATWNIKPTTDAAGTKTIAVFNRKHNLAPQQSPFGIDMHVTADRTTFRLCDSATVEEFASQVPLAQRLRSVLKAGAKTREQIAAELEGEKPETLRRTVNRGIEKGHLVRFPGPQGTELIALKASA